MNEMIYLFSTVLRAFQLQSAINKRELQALHFASARVPVYEYYQEWNAEPDCCEQCDALDGVRIRTYESFPMNLHPKHNPPHPNCKCRVRIGRGRIAAITPATRGKFRSAYNIMKKYRDEDGNLKEM